MDVFTCLRVRAGWGPCALIAVKHAVIIADVPYALIEVLQRSWGSQLAGSVRTTGNERASFGINVLTCLRVRAGWGHCALIAVKRAVIIADVPYALIEVLQNTRRGQLMGGIQASNDERGRPNYGNLLTGCLICLRRIRCPSRIGSR